MVMMAKKQITSPKLRILQGKNRYLISSNRCLKKSAFNVLSQ